MKMNKIHRISLAGGLIGMLFTNPRGALDSAVKEFNQKGFRCVQIIPHTTTNALVKVLQLACLIVTLGIWTFGSGYLIVFEKDE